MIIGFTDNLSDILCDCYWRGASNASVCWAVSASEIDGYGGTFEFFGMEQGLAGEAEEAGDPSVRDDFQAGVVGRGDVVEIGAGKGDACLLVRQNK